MISRVAALKLARSTTAALPQLAPVVPVPLVVNATRSFSSLGNKAHREKGRGQRRAESRALNSEKDKDGSRGLLTTLEMSPDDSSIAICTMRNPKKLNGWTQPMMEAMHRDFAVAATDDSIKGLVVTGEGDYYSAGVDLSGTIKPMAPAKLKEMIRTKNQLVFDTFLDFKKPVVCAINGPAIGASVTTATLSEGIVAAKEATFNTPFARLGVPPEGCSSVHFKFLMGEENAQRMLGKEGWVPTGEEAADVGLITKCVEKEVLVDEAVQLCASIAAEGRERRAMGQSDIAMMKSVNAKESADLADAFLGEEFLTRQQEFLSAKGKTMPAMVFKLIIALRPLWSKTL